MADAASISELPNTGTLSRGVNRHGDSADDAPPVGRPVGAPASGTTRTVSVAGSAAPGSEKSPASANVTAKSKLPDPTLHVAPQPARRFGRWFSALCALLSLVGAGVALTAPMLRPQAFALASAWLGADSSVSRYLAPPATGSELQVPAPLTYPTPAFKAPETASGDTSLQAAALAAVRAELIATLRLELDQVRRTATEQGARVTALGASVQAEKTDIASARSEARAAGAAAEAATRAQAAATHAQETAARALDGATERLDRVEAQVAAFDARVRATGLVVAAGQLRHDIDAGAPLHDVLAALTGSGPLPGPVQLALERLSRSEGGVPTLRDLGVGFEAVEAAIAAHGGGPASWITWSGWFGGGTQRETLDRLRALADEGRFGEVADVLERTEWADLAQRWGIQVRQRSAAVIAGQTVLANALASYEASQTTPPTWPQIVPSTGPGRASP
jgi:hypothetical protein